MKIIALIGCGILLAGLASGPVDAGQTAPTSVAEILQVQHALRAKLDSPSGEYSRFDADAIHRMEAAQDRIFAMLNGVTSIDQLNAKQTVDLSNDLELVKATLFAQEGNRVICHIERKTGTNLAERRCETVANRNKNVEESRVFMADHPHNDFGSH